MSKSVPSVQRPAPSASTEPLERRVLLAAATPDLAVSFAAKPPTTVSSGGAVQLKILNKGPKRAAGPVTVDLYASTDPTLDRSTDTRLAPAKKLTITANSTSTNLTVSFKYPKSLAEGDYYLIAAITPAAAIHDSNPADDTVASPTLISFRKPFVNLTPTVTIIPKSPITAGAKNATPASVTVAVKNTGTAPARGKVAISVFASTDRSHNDDPDDTLILKLPARSISIAPGGTSTFTIPPRQLPKSTPSGAFYAVAVITPAKPVHDLYTYDNEASSKKRFTVKNPKVPALPAISSVEKPGPAPSSISLQNLSPNTFNPVSTPLAFTLPTGSFDPDPANSILTINGATVPSSSLTITGNTLSAGPQLTSGKNTISLTTLAADTALPLYFIQTLWAGSSTLTVNLENPDASPFTSAATVTATLGDDDTVSAVSTASGGSAVFHNVPDRTILINASADNGQFGVVGSTGNASSVTLTMNSLGTPSTIDNNDFSDGLNGWTVSGPTVTVGPHQDPPAPAAGPSSGAPIVKKPDTAAPTTDFDLTVGTDAEGESSATRTFNTAPGTSSVTVRYRFVTSEIPGGFFGSKYNDYFRVTLRSTKSNLSRTATMNGLGLAAFTPDGSTQWFDVSLPVDPAGDTVRVDAVAANVGDGAYDSQLIVSAVLENKANIQPELTWNDKKGGLDLAFKMTGQPLTDDQVIRVFFASGTTAADALKQVYSYIAPKGTKAGHHGFFPIPGTALKDAPDGTTHLIAVAGDNVVALPDVKINFGSAANPDAVSAKTLAALKEFGRIAGADSITINSTARTPEDQARAMFNNLTSSANSIQANIQNQLNLYAAPGDAVVHVFASAAGGKTREQILQQSASIQAAMVTEIKSQGPSKVSKHCGDPSVLNVVDIGYANFPSNGTLFVNAASTDKRVSKLINEPENNCYHLELPQDPPTTPLP